MKDRPLLRRAAGSIAGSLAAYLAVCALLVAADLATGGRFHGSVTFGIIFTSGYATGQWMKSAR